MGKTAIFCVIRTTNTPFLLAQEGLMTVLYSPYYLSGSISLKK